MDFIFLSQQSCHYEHSDKPPADPNMVRRISKMMFCDVHFLSESEYCIGVSLLAPVSGKTTVQWYAIEKISVGGFRLGWQYCGPMSSAIGCND